MFLNNFIFQPEEYCLYIVFNYSESSSFEIPQDLTMFFLKKIIVFDVLLQMQAFLAQNFVFFHLFMLESEMFIIRAFCCVAKFDICLEFS